MRTPPRSTRPRRALAAIAALALAPIVSLAAASPAHAAKSDGCEGGGYQLVNISTGQVVATGPSALTIPAASFGPGDRLGVRGRYNSFDIRLPDFAIFDYAFTGAPNPLVMTGGVRTPVWESKIPDHRGLVLTSGISADIENDDLAISRTGPGVSMTITAKDCAAGGIYQAEPQRADGTRTRFVHTLASGNDARTPFYYDNPNFRAHIGEFLGSDCTSITTGPPSRFCVKVSARVNITSDATPKLLLRDSAQVATRILQSDCNTAAPLTPSVEHCGGVSVWDVASGGRMGFVTGEDAVEVSNPPTNCTQQCQAQNQVRGRLAVLGSPVPVPAGSRLTPRVSALPLPALTP